MLLEKLPDLFKTHATTESILIDIPIGLSTKDSPRTIDTLLRKSLIPRGSTVFNAPCRAAIYATDFNSARRINMAVEGKSLSAQTLNITSKIRETDELIRENNYSAKFNESHPELCFKYLNPSRSVVRSKKSTPEGIEQRLQILELYEHKTRSIFRKIIGETKRKDVKKDDIIDALCLCIVNKLGFENGLSYLSDNHDKDHIGIPIKIAYFDPK